MRFSMTAALLTLGMAFGLLQSSQAQPPENPSASHPDPSTGQSTAMGEVRVDVTDVRGRNLPAMVELRSQRLRQPIRIHAPKGTALQQCPAGRFRAYVTVYQDSFPSVVAVKNIEVKLNEEAYVFWNLLEGTAGNLALRDFDQDGDLVLDRVEVEQGTDPSDAGSFPGAVPVPYNARPLDNKAGWFRGEFHALSSYGEGTASVAELIKQAEKLKLDFLAITDRNTMDACMDPAFESKSVVLIPAMEWGNDERGVALILGPRTFPKPADTIADAQGISQRVQAQGGIFAIAHPCFPTCPWQWGLRYVNAIEVWCRDWRAVPPASLEVLAPGYGKRESGELVYSIAQAAETRGLSANGQAALFWDYELLRGLRASPIGGSRTADPKVPMAQPVTYVYAQEKSLPAILEGLWFGRTFVSTSLDGPTLDFTADVKKADEGKHDIDVGMGGIVPLGVETELLVRVKGAKGKKVQILHNGLPILSKIIESNKFATGLVQKPLSYSVYRVRVIAAPEKEGFGNVDVLAMSSAIYALEFVVLDTEEAHPEEIYEEMTPSGAPRVKATDVIDADGTKWIRPDNRVPLSKPPTEFVPPPGARIREITTKPLDE